MESGTWNLESYGSAAVMTRLIPDWEIRITNFGLGYVLMCLVVAIGATNTGNNGLYLVLAGMLAAMVVSGIISRRNVRRWAKRP